MLALSGRINVCCWAYDNQNIEIIRLCYIYNVFVIVHGWCYLSPNITCSDMRLIYFLYWIKKILKDGLPLFPCAASYQNETESVPSNRLCKPLYVFVQVKIRRNKWPSFCNYLFVWLTNSQWTGALLLHVSGCVNINTINWCIVTTRQWLCKHKHNKLVHCYYMSVAV